MSKHTQGPWHLDKNRNVYGANGEIVVSDGSDGFCPIGEYFDAQLIVSAPELLEALKGIVTYWDEVVPPKHMNDMHKAARAAIAKAEGHANNTD